MGEGGVILILTLFVLLITYAMVTQLTLSTSVAWMTSKNASDRIRMELACKSAAEQILGVLADDAAGGDLGGASGEAQSLLGELGYADGGADTGGATGAEGEDADEEEPDSDSLQDSWAKPMRVVMGDIQITSWVQDECGKFNLLTLVSPGIEERDAAKERCQRILDEVDGGFWQHRAFLELVQRDAVFRNIDVFWLQFAKLQPNDQMTTTKPYTTVGTI